MPRGDVLGVVALDEDGRAAGDLDVLDRPPHLAARFHERLAALHRDGARQIVELLLEPGLEREEKLHALGHRDPAPVQERPRRRLRGSVHVAPSRERRAVELFACRGVDDRERFGGR
jgi:hypothetical protein